MYKKLLIFSLSPLVCAQRTQIPTKWNLLKGAALGTAIAAGGSCLAQKLTSGGTQGIGSSLSLGAGTLAATWYIVRNNPDYRFGQIAMQYDCLIGQALTPVVKKALKAATIDALVQALAAYYVNSINPYYEAFADIVRIRKEMSAFLTEAKILQDHFYHDEVKRERLELFTRKIRAYHVMYARVLVLLKSTAQYRHAIHLQQKIEQTEALERIERLAQSSAPHWGTCYHCGALVP